MIISQKLFAPGLGKSRKALGVERDLTTNIFWLRTSIYAYLCGVKEYRLTDLRFFPPTKKEVGLRADGMLLEFL